jgi:hypothetical protein
MADNETPGAPDKDKLPGKNPTPQSGDNPVGGQSAQGGTSQDAFGQSGHNNTPDQTSHNFHGGGTTGR